MEKKTKIILIVSLIIILIGAAYFIYKYTSLPTLVSEKLGGAVNSGGATSFIKDYGDVVNTDTVLSFGQKSNNVVRLQQMINEIITKYSYTHAALSVDGVYGLKTSAALKFISNDTLKSGDVTVNKVANLPKNTGLMVANVGYATTASPGYGG